MRKIKISLAAVAFALTMGATFLANGYENDAPNDCSSVTFSPTGDLDSDNCDRVDEQLCCYELNSDTQIRKSL